MSPKSITLDQLVALNDEIAALVRCGVPLDRGLVRAGQELPGRLGKLAAEIGRRLESGQSLSQVVSSADSSFPPLYQAVVEAGVRSGRLAVALEGLSNSVRRVAELRRLVGVSLLYPLAVVAVAYSVFVFTAAKLMPVMVDNYRQFGLQPGAWLELLAWVGHSAAAWWMWPPAVALVLLVALWIRSGSFSAGRGTGLAGRLPTFGRLLRAGRLAAFAEILTLLVQHEVPLDEAVVLAADASGDRQLQESSRALAERIARGQPPGARPPPLPAFPPLLAWLIGSSRQPGELAGALRHVAETYHARTRRMSDWLLVYLPILLSVGIGGTATAVLAFSILGSWFHVLYQLAKP